MISPDVKNARKIICVFSHSSFLKGNEVRQNIFSTSFSLRSFTVAVLAFFASVMVIPIPVHAQWHSWPQWQRYGATVNVALSQNGFDTGMDSKKWAELVIYSASCTAVRLPQTKPNMYEWYPDQNVYKFPMPYPPSSWRPGQIVQMKWNHRPRTAIVIVPNENEGMYWVDCDWERDGIVRYHFVSYADFSEKVGENYSVYEIH